MAKNNDFDFENFTISAIKTIDEIRSFGKDAATSPIEPRINAFYRAIGLPVTVSMDTDQQSLNNGNIFSSNTLNYAQYSTALNIRKFAFRRDISQDEIDRFLNFSDDKFSDSIQDVADPSHKARARGVLFPMVVDGEIPIFPQEKRVADAFRTEDDLLIGRVKYRRPLIEAIVLMRLKSEGAQNKDLQNKITADFGNTTLNDLSKISPLINTAMINSLNGLGDLLKEAVKNAGKIKKETGINLSPIIANIAQQSLIRNETSANLIGKLDLQKQRQAERLKTEQAILTSLEYDDTFSGDIKESRNIKNSLLASNVLSIIHSGLGNQSKAQKDIDDTDKKIEKRVYDVKTVFRLLDLLLGTFGGISGVDIIIVIASLFSIDLNALFGLLNQEAINNLENIKGKGIANSRLAVSDAIDALQSKVTDLFSQVESNSMQTKHAQKRARQENEET